MKTRLLTALLPVVLATAASAEQPLLPLKVTEKTLPNGLRVMVVPTGFPNLVTLQIPMQTGSRNEVEPGKSGFAHFFEHMMFRGTKNVSAEEWNRIVSRAGANPNAFTSDDFTNYHMTFAKEDLETILKLEADRFQNLDYPEAAFKTEARAVLGEYNKNSASPFSKLFEVMQDAAYTTHTYKHTTMGFLKDIEDMPNQYAYSKTFFDRWYRPEYAAVIVAGDVTPEAVLPLVEKYWGSWKRGSYTVEIPREPEAKGPIRAHVPWPSDTLPLVTVAFHGPAFSETEKDPAAMDLLFNLYFGETSDLYKKLVEQEQKVDRMFGDGSASVDPGLLVAAARVKKLEDTVYVRDEILRTFAQARSKPVTRERLDDARANAKYDLLRGLTSTGAIGSLVARYARFRRSFDTLNAYYKVYESLTPDDLVAAARRYFTDANLVVTTLSRPAMPAAFEKTPSLASFAASVPAATLTTLEQRSALPQLAVKLFFPVGSAHDPKGKEGLARLAASMLSEAGSKDLKIDEINKALFPMAAGIGASVDREMTVFTAAVHRDNWSRFLDVALPMLTRPGFRQEDFDRLREAQKNALVQDLRSSNEEELGKERLQERLFAGTPYGHTVLGTEASLAAITLDDVKDFVARAYTQAALVVGLSGDVPAEMKARLAQDLAALPAGPALAAPQGVAARKPKGYEVEIVEKETRATAISFGHPIDVTRSHPDFAALTVARSFLGEHRSSSSWLFQRIREIRGMNYGDYAYIEAFPGGMFRSIPGANVGRRAQLFEVWIRPVVPANAHMATRIALHELQKLVEKGMTQKQFETTRDYLMKYVYSMTSTQDLALGYALDARWYGTDEFTKMMRDRLSKLTVADVNRAVRKHLSWKDLSFVFITKDAEGLKKQLLADGVSTVTYDAAKPKEILDEDKVIGARKLGLTPDRVTITKAETVFAK